MQHIRPINYEEPKSLSDACACLSREGALPLAGGTDLTVMLRRNGRDGLTLVNLKKIPGLTGISRLAGGGIQVGALTTVADMAAFATDPELAALGMGCAALGTPSVRNLATMGGNVGRASPASDVLPGLLVLEAHAVLAGPEGERVCALADLLAGPGRLHLRPGEFLTALQIFPEKGDTGAYFKAGRVRGADCALAGAAVRLHLQNGRICKAHIALTAVGPTPLRARQAEALLEGQAPSAALFDAAGAAAAGEARPITDLRGCAEYKKELAGALTIRALRHATGKI